MQNLEEVTDLVIINIETFMYFVQEKYNRTSYSQCWRAVFSNWKDKPTQGLRQNLNTYISSCFCSNYQALEEKWCY